MGPEGIGGIRPVGQGERFAPAQQGTGFKDVLAAAVDKSGELKFSRHASERLESRGISIPPAELDRIRGAVDRADSAGCRESVLLTENLALVVSITNRTVITCVDRDSCKGNLFTNIDSVALV
jgi:flagellar operon protein